LHRLAFAHLSFPVFNEQLSGRVFAGMANGSSRVILRPRSKTLRLATGILLFALPALGAESQKWVEVRSQHFTIVSDAGTKAAADADVHFEQIRMLLRRAIPVADRSYEPVITVFAVKNENSMRTLLPEYWKKGRVHPAGIFFSRLDQDYAAVALDTPGDNPYEPLYHEYCHSLTLHFTFGVPLWLSEGLAEFFGSTRIEDKKAYIGPARPEFVRRLRQDRLIPLRVMLQVGRNSPFYNDAQKSAQFYAEAWALTHYLLVGDNGRYRHLLDAYLNALGHGGDPIAASESLGDLAALEDALAKYVRSYRFYSHVEAAPPEVPRSSLKIQLLSDAEVSAESGGFEAARGQMQLAMPFLTAAVSLNPALPRVYRNLALAQIFNGQNSEAMKSLDRAISLNPHNALCRYLRAYLTVKNQGAIMHDVNLEADLLQSVESDPNFPPASALFAVYLSLDPAKLREALTFARRAVALQPEASDFQVALAQVFMRMRRYDDAQAALERARATARTPAERAEAGQLFATLRSVRQKDAEVASASGMRRNMSARATTVPGLDTTRSATGDTSAPISEGAPLRF
jgi:tetratricopeptide (TPR) repeat protein